MISRRSKEKEIQKTFGTVIIVVVDNIFKMWMCCFNLIPKLPDQSSLVVSLEVNWVKVSVQDINFHRWT
jgi:hypothetical protein